MLLQQRNAGPEKGDSDKDIGLIYFYCYLERVKSFEFNFGKNREKNINKSVNKALELLFSNYHLKDKKFGITVKMLLICSQFKIRMLCLKFVKYLVKVLVGNNVSKAMNKTKRDLTLTW